MNIFEQPLIGPFVERNDLTDTANTGATITWTSGSEAYRLDLVRLATRSIWVDSLGFAQFPDLNFEQFLWHCFECNNRLPDFLNELRPFIRPSRGAPSPAEAGKWLNPSLVAKGFSLGIAKVRGGHTVRIPVIWVFGGNAAAYGSRSQYARIDFIDWTPSDAKLLRHHYFWGVGARALRRLLHQSVDSLNDPLLTEAGEARMHQLLSWSCPKPPAEKLPIPFTQDEKATTAWIRKLLHNLPNPLPTELKGQLIQLPEKAYAGLLRTCVKHSLPKAARTLLLHRPLPTLGRQRLLEQFIDAQWLEIWVVCANEANPDLTTSHYRYNALLHRIMETGNLNLLQAVLDALTTISAPVIQYLLEQAFEHNRADMFNAILVARPVQPIRSECLLGCFKDCLFDHRESQRLALHLLEMGIRPLQSIKPDEPFDHCGWLIMKAKNFPVLKRALELEPPTHESLLRLLGGGALCPGASFNHVCLLSRQLPQHKFRMTRVAFHAATAFVRCGEADLITLLEQAFQEGASFKDIPASDFEKYKLLTGHKWKEREGNWIDLIGLLLKAGRTEDAEVIKKFKRPRPKKSAR